MSAPANKVDVLSPTELAAAREMLFCEFVELLPPENRNFGPYLHRGVYEALAGNDGRALDAAERFLIVRDCGHIPDFADMRAEIVRTVLAKAVRHV